MSSIVRLDNAASLHPTIHLTFPDGFLETTTEDLCHPAVLIRLPPALFLDPNTFLNSQPLASVQITSVRHLNSTQDSLKSYDFNKVELELGVGYSNPAHRSDVKEEAVADRTRPVRPRSSQVKRVGENQFVVAGDQSGRSRYQDEYADSQHFLAKEYRAAFLTLQTKKKTKNELQEALSEKVEYDELTGEKVKGEVKKERPHTLDIPIHSRYVSPQMSELSLDQIWKSSLSPSAGNYEQVLLDKPELFWMCNEVEYLFDSAKYDKVQPRDLLPSPHSHLSWQLTPHESHWHFYRYKIPFQEAPFQINIPAGNASLGPFVQLITFTSLFLAAIWTAIQVQAAMTRVHKTQSQIEKRHSSKSQ